MTVTLEELFDLIHRGQAEAIYAILQRGDPTAQEINAINKFLSDNNITGAKGDNAALKKLSDGLEAFEKSDNVVGFRANG